VDFLLTVQDHYDTFFFNFRGNRVESELMTASVHWTVRDRYGNDVYLTQERWKHIVEPINHPEMSEFERHLEETVGSGVRKQDLLNPQKYRYILRHLEI